jgi:hypothetical protein
MLQIMIGCKRTGQFVPAGIETDIDTFMALPEALSLPGAPHAAAIIIGQKGLGFATLNLHCARCCLPRAATSCCAGGPMMHPRQGTAPGSATPQIARR